MGHAHRLLATAPGAEEADEEDDDDDEEEEEDARPTSKYSGQPGVGHPTKPPSPAVSVSRRVRRWQASASFESFPKSWST